MGTSKFALPSLKLLVENNANIVAVYTQPPRRVGRGNNLQLSPIGQFAQHKRLKLLHPESFLDFSEIQMF